MKTKSAVRKMCEHCFVVRRRQKLYVYCKVNKKHKQRQGMHTAIQRQPPVGWEAAGADVLGAAVDAARPHEEGLALLGIRGSACSCEGRWEGSGLEAGPAGAVHPPHVQALALLGGWPGIFATRR